MYLKEYFRELLNVFFQKLPFYHMQYKLTTMRGKVYFGKYLMSKQGKPTRHYFMQRVIERECKDKYAPFILLEIGSWAGGSAITWADALKNCSVKNGHIVCIDPWSSYLNTDLNEKAVYKAMENATKRDRIFNLFLYNIRAHGCDGMITPIRGFSDSVLPMLRQKQFDLIYVDGNHLYKSVLKDLRNASPLLKDGGILCGDDLELQYPSLNDKNLSENIIYDYSLDESTGTYYHPGVSLAVWEFFGQVVSEWDGFWAMRKFGDEWQKVALDYNKEDVKIPGHLI